MSTGSSLSPVMEVSYAGRRDSKRDRIIRLCYVQVAAANVANLVATPGSKGAPHDQP